MKSIAKNLKHLVIALILIGSASVLANSSKEETNINMAIPTDEVTGAWEYTVENVPIEYSKGVLMISKENKEYSIKIQLAAGVLGAENVLVKDKTITFSVYVEGSKVSVTLKVNGDIITGESSSYDGNFAIEGKRMQPE